MEYKFQAPDGTVKTVNLIQQADGTFNTTIDDQVYVVTIERSRGQTFWLQINERRELFHVARNSTNNYIAFNGQTISLEKHTGGSRGAGKSQQGGDLTASMPGQVIEILVQNGEVVEKGQTVIILEAMKMEMRVKAPYAGIVKQLLCTPGATVDRGQILIEIEENSSANEN